MSLKSYEQDLIDLHYKESSLSLQEIAKKHGRDEVVCQQDLEALRGISQAFQSWKMPQVSSLTLQRIRAEARACSTKEEGWLSRLWNHSFSNWALSACASFLLFAVAWNIFGPLSSGTPQNSTQVVSSFDSSVTQRLLETPLDVTRASRQNFTGQLASALPTQNYRLSRVSLSTAPLDLDDMLDQRSLSGNLSERDIETLYFRARKFEKLGYVEKALEDYQFLSKTHPQTIYRKHLPIAMARCYEKLGQKEQAIEALSFYIENFGAEDAVQVWVDQLKSESF